MEGRRIAAYPAREDSVLPFGVLLVDFDGTIKAYRPFEGSPPVAAPEPLIGLNFFSDVAPFPLVRRFHDRFYSFVALDGTSVEPFEFVSTTQSGRERVTILFVRDEDVADRISIIIMRNGDLA